MPGVFVTATGTDVGKTYVTAGLLRAGRRAGLVMEAFKPVLSGYRDDDAVTSDAGVLLGALDREITPDSVAAMSPWRFAAPLSPDMAAAAEARAIDVDAVIAACHAMVRPDRLVLIEGVGGVMVPLDAGRTTVLTMIAALHLPVVLVSATGLGAISHCLTASEVMAARGLPAPMIVLNETAGSTVPLDATRATIAAFCPDSAIATLARDADETAFDRLLLTLLAYRNGWA